MRLKSVAYTSRVRPGLAERDIGNIQEAARHLNALDGISGLLVFDGDRFLQIVEGAESAIDDLVGRLRRDARHYDFEIRDERFVEARSFPDWSMEFIKVNASYRDARGEIASILPEHISPAVRDLALQMADDLSAR